MKKTALVLTALLITACAPSQPPAQVKAQSPQIQKSSTSQRAVSAQTGLPIALKKIKQIDPAAQLYEIDIWQEAAGKSLHYGFLPQQGPGAIRVIINVETQAVKVENTPQGTQKNLIQGEHWKVDSEAIYKRAQANGLRDQYYLATLWENTWHISGLKQHLYFQMDSQNGAIKLRCIGPYLNNCTLADGTPVSQAKSLGQEKHIQARQNAR